MEHLNHFLSCGAYNHTSIRFHWSLNKICGLWLKPFTNLTFSGAGKSLHGTSGQINIRNRPPKIQYMEILQSRLTILGCISSYLESRTPWMIGKHQSLPPLLPLGSDSGISFGSACGGLFGQLWLSYQVILYCTQGVISHSAKLW